MNNNSRYPFTIPGPVIKYIADLILFFQVPNFNNVTMPPNEQNTAQEIDSYFRQELIYKRNERMGKRVKTLLEEHPDKSFFFAFGAGKTPNKYFDIHY